MLQLHQANTVFVTGTDTEVGKTFCSEALLAAWALQGLRVAGYKPVASGIGSNGCNEDVLALQAASNVCNNHAKHNIHTYAEATAPHLAAQDSGMAIDIKQMSRQLALWQQHTDLVLVEGAGGWHTPLNEHIDFADWVAAERLPVILVVGIKLGAINHALLTAHAIAAADLPFLGWIANCVTPQPHRLDDYVASLSARLPVPLLGVLPHMPDSSAAERASHLDLTQLQWP